MLWGLVIACSIRYTHVHNAIVPYTTTPTATFGTVSTVSSNFLLYLLAHGVHEPEDSHGH